jgi:diaminohydroxyphosphoribosylaminopyrimidine deaminase/5-amino-6-(5-phosphoribosylamino)uracil reductase
MNGAALSFDASALRTLLEELSEAARAFRFDVAPNPCVGAAILAGTRLVARGFHEVWGGPHAEMQALAAAALTDVAPSTWDTLVVTLEPCSSRGKTGACVDAILATGVRTVVVGALDPDRRHDGRGVELLRAAGLEVVVVEGAARLERVAPHFERWNTFERLRRPRPWTIAKWAQTLSGHLSPPDTDAGPVISGPEALAEVQLLRGRVDAILTGVGTVLADDPRLTVRAPGNTANPPARVVLDSWLRTSRDARLFAPTGADEAGGPVHILSLSGSGVVRQRALRDVGAEVHGLRGADRQRLHLREVQTWLWNQGFRRVLVEAGPELLAGLLAEDFVDQVRVVTGAVRGGRGTSLANWLANARLLERRDSECGEDAVIEAFLAAE